MRHAFLGFVRIFLTVLIVTFLCRWFSCALWQGLVLIVAAVFIIETLWEKFSSVNSES